MPIYKAPFRDQQFVMHEVLGAVDMLRPLSRYADLDADTLNQVIEEAGKFCEELLLPVNQSGDAEGCTYDVASRSVKTPRGFKEAYDAFCAAGWPDWRAKQNTAARDCRTCCRSRFMRCSIRPIRRGRCIRG